ncbi:Sperm-tail PG-rich repeat-containing protein 2 [Microtus ochrogaster]|uniref:Sperm-tail PG-rich repeat-containing protein 2 n=1 Tax=Microtus ochrogaster TaxID=79684 RepID=A0A8J6GYU0_MICOH|nr:Sperm-tail PG-rich repeat-containing protein 2 [Microtus ochrogaster]
MSAADPEIHVEDARSKRARVPAASEARMASIQHGDVGMMTPAPGSYDVQKSYDMSQVKHNYMPPRSSVAQKKHSSFLSATPRYLGKIDDGPGPATYNPVLMKSSAIISFCKGPKRFGHFPQAFSPGPTTYEVCQLFLLALA